MLDEPYLQLGSTVKKCNAVRACSLNFYMGGKALMYDLLLILSIVGMTMYFDEAVCKVALSLTKPTVKTRIKCSQAVVCFTHGRTQRVNRKIT